MSSLKYFSCIVLFLFSSRIYSQIPDTIWTKTFGGPLADVGTSVKQTSDGGFIVAATTSSFGAGGQDIWLIKTDENGDSLWTKIFGGTGNDRASNVVQTNDNGYAVFGTTNSFGNGGDDFLIWKTDSLGSTEWFKTFGGINNEVAYDGEQLSDSNYVIVGDTVGQNLKAWLIKTDKYGNFIWGRTIGTNSYGVSLRGRSVQQTNDGRYAVSGIHSSVAFPPDNVYDYFLSKVSASGNIILFRYYGALNFLGAWGVIVKKLSDGNLILGGTIREFSGGAEKPWIIKTDQNGNVIWDHIILGSQYPAVLTSIEPTNDNGFIFTIYGPNISVLKCDENGILTWEKIVGGPLYDEAYSISQISDGGYIVTGETKSIGAGNYDIWLLKFKNPPSPNIQVSKDSLNLTFDSVSFTSKDSLVIYNTGDMTLNIDTIYSRNASGFILDIILKDTTIHTSVTWRNSYSSPFELEPNDSAKLIFTYPLWVPKSLNITETWRDTVIILNNSLNNSSLAIPMLIDFPVGISSENNSLPLTFSLSQNYPNPFNPSTVISYQLPVSGIVTLKVYDILGNEIATLVNEEKSAGTYEVEFNTSSIKHLPSSGIYFYQLRAGSFVETKKMILLK